MVHLYTPPEPREALAARDAVTWTREPFNITHQPQSHVYPNFNTRTTLCNNHLVGFDSMLQKSKSMVGSKYRIISAIWGKQHLL